MGTSSISKNLKVYGKETDLGFYRAPFCFLDQSSPESLAEVALCLSSLTPGLTQGPTHWLGTGMVRRKDMGWLLCLSLAWGCSNRTQGEFQKMGADFQTPHSLPDDYTGHSFNM